MVGDASIPLMLISLGVRLAEARWATGTSASSAVSCARSPASRWRDCCTPLLGLDATQQGLLFSSAALPPAVLNFMVAEQYGQEPAKVASIVLIGNMMAVLFVPLGLSLALR